MRGFWNRIKFSRTAVEPVSLPVQKPADWRAMLAAVPQPNLAVSQEPDPAARSLRLVVKKKKPPFLVPPISWVLRPRLERRVDLDRLGTEVWHLCNGRRSVEEIVLEFSRRYELSFHESRMAVTSYLKELVQRGAMVMMFHEEPSDHERESRLLP